MLKENKKMFDMTNTSVWQQDNLGEGTTIVILDEGHEDNHFKYVRGNMEIPIPYKSNDRDHGVATVAVGYQIAPNAKVIYMDFNSANNDTREKMVQWIIDNKGVIDVINVSLNYRKSIADKYFPRLAETNIPIICASGNDGYEDKVAYPSRYPFTISVGAYSPNNGGRTYYSNSGKELDCIADAGTYYPNNFGKPSSQFGTSFSSPNVAYSLLLYFNWRKRNRLPKLTPDEVRQFIKENALDLYEEGHDYKSGYGLFRLPSLIPIIEESEDDMAKFNDTKQHWAEQHIDFVSDKGWMNGVGEGNFAPDKPMTRAELATVLARMNGFVPKK